MGNATIAATIMVVEDDVPVRELLVLALEANAFDAVAAGNTADALSHLQSRHVDLLLLDLRLGTESGIDLLKAIRQMSEYEKLPVILLTGCADRNIVLEIAHLGVQGYVLKHQFSRKDLIARINQQLKNRESAYPAADAEIPPPAAIEATEPRNTCTTSALPPETIPDGETDADSAAQPEVGSVQFDLLRSVKPIVTRAQTLAQVDRCAELKALSPAVSQLMAITAVPDCSFDQISRIINLDQAIALKILKIANSVLYGCERSIDTAQQALSRIGVSQVRQFVLGMSVIDNFQTVSLGEHFNRELFWEHSIATGLIAAAITRFRNGERHAIDFAFTMGLLHDVARMVFVEQLDDLYKRVLNTAGRLQLPLEQVESRMLLINHADVVNRLLNTWNFPRRLVDPIAMHHLPDEKILALAPHRVAEVATLALANRLAHALLLGSSGNNCQNPTEVLVRILDLKPDAITSIQDQIPDQTVDLKRAMLQSNDSPHGSDYRQKLLKKFRRPIRPLYISANPAVDGYRILLERLRETNYDRHPNVAVLYLANTRDKESLFKTLRESENAAGLKPLPIVVISPSPNLTLDPAFFAGRDHEIMPSPFALSRLADAMNTLLLSED
jgi:HD-like signal output (HDOD) protein/DNA-binding response OmpR family regulator